MANKTWIAASIVCATAYSLFATTPTKAPDLEIGRNLQTWTQLTLAHPAPEQGLEVKVVSEDPHRLLLAHAPDAVGSASIVLKIHPKAQQTPEFWVQAFGSEGEVGYTASDGDRNTWQGTVRLSPSSVAIHGPFKGTFTTTPRGLPASISVMTVRLDSSGRVAEPQYLAGGRKLALQMRVSDPAVGKAEPEELVITGGAASAVALFRPSTAGTATIDAVVPEGWQTPTELASVTANVVLPGLMITDDGTEIGENLQAQVAVGLGEPSPKGGVVVRVTSNDPARLLISATASEKGVAALDVPIPEGKVNAPVYLQSLARSGVVKCTASAPGYRERTAEIHLAPSGVVLMYKPYGPPDEAEVLRAHHTDPSPTTTLYLKMGKTKKVPLNVWTVRLDPKTLRAADITVQPLRGGHSLEVEVKGTDPKVGSIKSPVKIRAGTEVGVTEYVLRSSGKSILSVVTPEGFVTSANSTAITAVITK